jgi:hypothetical protein
MFVSRKKAGDVEKSQILKVTVEKADWKTAREEKKKKRRILAGGKGEEQ